MLQRTTLCHGVVRVQVTSSWSSAAAVILCELVFSIFEAVLFVLGSQGEECLRVAVK